MTLLCWSVYHRKQRFIATVFVFPNLNACNTKLGGFCRSCTEQVNTLLKFSYPLHIESARHAHMSSQHKTNEIWVIEDGT